ncbi:MAG: hypothetical protein R3F55_17075 [Alphaproteobacteria bacterium]
MRTTSNASPFNPFRAAAAAFAFAGAAVVSAAPASAQQMLCGERDGIVSTLSDSWHEERTAIGLSNTGAVYEVFSSPDGTWTILLTTPDGPTCLVGAGEHWETMMLQVAGEPV